MTSFFHISDFAHVCPSIFFMFSYGKSGWQHQVCPFLGIFRPFLKQKRAIEMVQNSKSAKKWPHFFISPISLIFVVRLFSMFCWGKNCWKRQVSPFLGIFRPCLKQKRPSEMAFSSLVPLARVYRANHSKQSESGE